MRVLITLIVILFTISNCSNLNIKKEHIENKRTDGEYDISRSISATPGKDDEKLDQGKYFLSKQQYKKAEQIFLEVYNNKKLKNKYREEALLLIADIYSNFFNTKKNLNTAITYCEKLLKEFPKTKLKDKAKEKIEILKSKL